LETESEYRATIKDLLKEYYSCFDSSAIKKFFTVEAKKRNWTIFNYLFIRKAIDMALDLGSNEREVCSKLLQTLTHECNFGNMDYGYAFDQLIWNHTDVEIDVPQFKKLAPMFIARAIVDGAVTYRYITDAEVSNHGESQVEEELFSSVLNVLNVKPLEYHMKHIWNSALSNDELIHKFKGMLGDFYDNYDFDYIGNYLIEL
jgi:hypothetical protein